MGENYDTLLWKVKRCAVKGENTINAEDGTVYTLFNFWESDRIVIAKEEKLNGFEFSGMNTRIADSYCEEFGFNYLGSASFYPLGNDFFVFAY